LKWPIIEYASIIERKRVLFHLREASITRTIKQSVIGLPTICFLPRILCTFPGFHFALML